MTDRIPYFENAKVLLCWLVVLGHAAEAFLDSSPTLRTLYGVLYAFHMPLFAAISGRFSSGSLDGRGYRAIVGQLLFPYLMFQVLYLLFVQTWGPRPEPPFSLLRPYWLMWFLCSLILWRALLPWVLAFRAPLFLSIVLALAAGFSSWIGYELSLSRTLVFLPFFVAGHLSARLPEVKPDAWKRGLAVAGFVAAIAVAYFRLTDLDMRWLYASYSYSALSHPGWTGAALRLLQLGVAALLSLSFLMLVPRSATRLTPIGSRTLVIFFLHGFVIRALQWSGTLDRLRGHAWTPVAVLVLGLVVAVLLSTSFIDRIARPLMQPKLLTTGLLASEGN
jgi:fucose 4-O-acetylase-like acetyltransferase